MNLGTEQQIRSKILQLSTMKKFKSKLKVKSPEKYIYD